MAAFTPPPHHREGQALGPCASASSRINSSLLTKAILGRKSPKYKVGDLSLGSSTAWREPCTSATLAALYESPPMPLTGIHNENEFYNHHYLVEISRARSKPPSNAGARRPMRPTAAPHGPSSRSPHPEYLRFRGDFNRERRSGQRILRQREWFRALLGALGHRCQPANHILEDGAEVPILCADRGPAHTPRLLVLGVRRHRRRRRPALAQTRPTPVPRRSARRYRPV